ncbi:CHAT domain-containing protein [Streptosporangium sp. NPDC002524]|uniref:CHAT domain-containing protein n=1 Tax=Streptosporangium sp. NPDC002524 TaxID=3154537 RepID=UPI00331E5511
MTGVPNGLRRALGGGSRSYHLRAAGHARAPVPTDGDPGTAAPRVLPAADPGGERLLPVTVADPTAGLPPRTARLKVWREGDTGRQSYALTGACCCGITFAYRKQPNQVKPSRLTLGALIKRGGESPTEMFIRLKNWSRDASQDLKVFLSEIRRAHGDDVHLIIEDFTGYDLPWDFLWQFKTDLPDTDLADGWLGALLPIARSVGTPSSATGIQCTGEILAHVAPDMVADRALLDRFRVTVRDVTLDDLLDLLDEKGDPLSLVYVACHGRYGKPDARFSAADIELVEGQRDSEQGVTLGEIRSRNLLRMRGTGGLVFLNACHSAREGVDPNLDRTTLRSFARVFLEAGASGFIGTMGKVGLQDGYELAKNLLDTLAENPDTPVAVALRDYRRKVWAQAPRTPRRSDQEAARRLRPFFYAFMYAYFGNPETTLRPVPREETR